MKIDKVVDIIKKSKEKKYRVTFDWYYKGVYSTDHFPDKDKGEPPFKTKEEAWKYALTFARSVRNLGRIDGKEICNITVVDDNFVPVPEYENKILINYTF